MFEEILNSLTFDQITELSGLPGPLLSISSDVDTEKRFYGFAKYLSGETTWDNLIKTKIQNKSYLEAYTYFVKSKQFGFEPSEAVLEKIALCQRKIDEDISDKTLEIGKILEGVDPRASESIRLSDSIKMDLSKIKVPSTVPLDQSDIDELDSIYKKISALRIDSKDLLDIADQEIATTLAEFHEIVQKSLDRFSNLLKEDKLIEGSIEASLFQLLPSIILNKDLNLLRKLADIDVPLKKIKILGVKDSGGEPRKKLTRAISKFRVSSYSFDPLLINLNPFSKAIYEGISSVNKKFYSIEDLKREVDKKVDHDERARIWFSAAKSNSDTEIVNWMIGEGLLSQGVFFIQNTNFTNARRVLTDAYSCIVRSGHYGELSLEKSVIAILVGWIWPKYAVENGSDQNGIDWINDPSLMIGKFRRGLFFYDIAKVWVDEIDSDEEAFQFLEILSTHIGDDRTLYRVCCERLLMPNIILKKADMMGNRLKWFLKDANPPAVLYELIDELVLEFTQKGKTTGLFKNRQNFNRILDSIMEELDNSDTDSVAPIDQVKFSLPAQINNIIKAHSKSRPLSDKPNLTVQPMVRTFYPDEQSDELPVPMLIRNDENASMATNLVVKLFCKDEQKYPIEIYQNTYEIGDLEPGNFHEAIFYLDLPDDITNSCTELSFRLQRIMGTAAESDDFTIKIKPGNRGLKKSPYTPGSAVSRTNFIGRKNELRRILSTLTGDSDQNAIIVFGNRRIGKTSILKYIEKNFEIERRYYPIFWDVEDYSTSNSSSGFLKDLIEKIINVLPKKYHSSLYFNRDEIKEQPYAAFERFVQSLDKSGIDKRILILFDEFDNLLNISKQTNDIKEKSDKVLGPSDVFEQETFSALRKALMSSRYLNIVFTGLPDLTIQDYQSRLFGLADQIQIKEFEDHEAKEVIDISKNIMTIQPIVRQMIIEAAGAQPFLLQVICHSLFYKNINSGRDIVSINDLHEVIDQIISTDSYFKDYISFIKDDIWITLHGLALSLNLRSEKRRYVYANEVHDSLLSRGYDCNIDDIRNTLKRLSEDSPFTRSLVKRTKNNYYRFSIGIIKDFILRKEVQ